MNYKPSQPWVPLERIEAFVQVEPALLTVSLVLVSWLISKFVLKGASDDRARTLKELFHNITYHLTFGLILFAIFYGIQQLDYENNALERVLSYVGLATILSGATVFVKVWRILVFEYLVFSHMRVAFPVLLVNLFTLMLSLGLGAWIGAEIFNIRLAPLLATSAIFSLVLGLALQDTLGNLFAGVALQIDKPYGIGDWIEIQTGTQRWVGQVHDISWRATVLVAFSEELLTIPNRVMSQAQISNYSTKFRPIIRSLVFRLPFEADSEEVKRLLIETALSLPQVRKLPLPVALISETTESWVSYKLAYYLDDFGNQFGIADKVYTKAIANLKKAGLELAGHRLVPARSEAFSTSIE